MSDSPLSGERWRAPTEELIAPQADAKLDAALGMSIENSFQASGT